MKKEKIKASALDWTKAIVAILLYLVFLWWVGSWWGVIVIPFIFDAYVTRFIPWTWWKDAENPLVRTVMSWVDAIVFALVAVYFVNIYFFQNYTIPTSSLEKSLLVGDYLFVSKMSYGPRVPQTPLHMPLCQHTLPWGGKSYIEWPAWEYKRVSPKPVQLNDIVVFNYPAGDTIVTNPAYQAADYYMMCYAFGHQLYEQEVGEQLEMDSLSALERYRLYQEFYNRGRRYISLAPQEFGVIDHRPVDRRENYVKRCVGLPGQTIELKDYFESNFKLLGLTDEIVELYRQEKYRAIIVIFLSSCRKYFIRQDLLDEESYSLLWDKAHDYIYEFINGSKRPSVRPHPAKKTRSSSSVIGYRKRSFSSHIATSGVWGRIAAYGGTNGRIIRINAGHGRR